MKNILCALIFIIAGCSSAPLKDKTKTHLQEELLNSRITLEQCNNIKSILNLDKKSCDLIELEYKPLQERAIDILKKIPSQDKKDLDETKLSVKISNLLREFPETTDEEIIDSISEKQDLSPNNSTEENLSPSQVLRKKREALEKRNKASKGYQIIYPTARKEKRLTPELKKAFEKNLNYYSKKTDSAPAPVRPIQVENVSLSREVKPIDEILTAQLLHEIRNEISSKLKKELDLTDQETRVDSIKPGKHGLIINITLVKKNNNHALIAGPEIDSSSLALKNIFCTVRSFKELQEEGYNPCDDSSFSSFEKL